MPPRCRRNQTDNQQPNFTVSRRDIIYCIVFKNNFQHLYLFVQNAHKFFVQQRRSYMYELFSLFPTTLHKVTKLNTHREVYTNR